MNIILIEVEGGLVSNVLSSSEDTKVIIIDHDVKKISDKRLKKLIKRYDLKTTDKIII